MIDDRNHRLTLRAACASRPLRVAALLAALGAVCTPAGAQLTIGNNPLFLVAAKANVLVILDNSNSMDEDASGAAVGSAAPNSKSEIARNVVRNLTDQYRSRVNMGLMAYRQGALADRHLHNSPYDISFDPAHFNPAWNGARNSPTNKRFRLAKPGVPGEFVHYNVALPFYSNTNDGTAYCYSPTAVAFNNGENPTTGPWDAYRCFTNKTGTSNALPAWGNAASEAANGWSALRFTAAFSPTDSDFAQGILDFGRFNSWNWVSRTWFNNASPGRGFLHVPIGDLNATQAAAIRNRLACNIPAAGAPCNAAGIANAGLTPIEGTLLTARDYFGGAWNVAAEGFTAACYPLPQSCGKNFVILLTDGLPSTDRNGALITNPAAGSAAAVAAATALRTAGVTTYVIGFALPFGTDPATLNALAAAGDSGTAYMATDAASLQSAFDDIFDDVFRRTSAFGAVSQNTTSITTGSTVFQGRFDSTDWSGELTAYRPSTSGTLSAVWSTSDAGRIPAASSRKVFTMVPGVGGKAFQTLSDLSMAQQTALATPACGGALATAEACGQARIDWVRGVRTQEDPTGPLRRRTRLLGDIISSSPFYANGTVYVGANDGMLHAFDAGTGNELFAFVPSAMMAKIPNLTSNNYVHDYFVDGDIAVSTEAVTPGKAILVGALGRGGRALFALDVTSPSTFSASNVKWEFTDPDLGLVLGRPLIAKLNNGRAAVLVGNGVNSDNHRAVLFIIDLDTGALIRKIDTQAGGTGANTNGMFTPRLWDNDGNGTADLVYAGDLQGNVWRFDLGSATATSWGSSFTSAGLPSPFFVARDASNNRQPITGMIGIGFNGRTGDPNFGKRYVFVGTGRYLVADDVTNMAVQTWYGLIDNGVQITGRASLRQRTVALEQTVSGRTARAFSAAAPGDMAGLSGWYLDFTSALGVAQGERMIGEQKHFAGTLVGASILPSNNTCTAGGSGFINAIDAFTGGAIHNPFFDLNNDLAFDSSDLIGTPARAASSVSPDINLPGDPILISNRLIASGTSGSMSSVSVRNPVRSGRISWREAVTR
jgi:type IV pilus assembly protein PilY1